MAGAREWKRDALADDGVQSEYFTKWDGSTISAESLRAAAPIPLNAPSHGCGRLASEPAVSKEYLMHAPIADYPPINYKPYPLLYGENGIVDTHVQALDITNELRKAGKKLPPIGLPASLGAAAGLAAGAGLLSMTGLLAAFANGVEIS
ncbi:MAG: hypothetical protein SGPRY_005427 [Prymnesium sp.]